MKLTRRGWVALAATAPVLAQVASSPQAVPPVAAAAPNKAADDIRKVSDRLAQTDVPMQVEPAFAFRA